MTEPLFHHDAYRREAPGRVLATGSEGIVLDASLFYAASGGQPSDTGRLDWTGGSLAVRDAVKAEGGAILLVPGEGRLPAVGTELRQILD